MLQTKALSFTYPDAPKPALSGVDLEIQKGEFVAVVGANGSGKSTLAKHFNAILVPAPGMGDVYVEGMNTKDPARLLDIRQRVGMVFQNPDNQIIATTVEEDVAFALENLGVPQPEMRRRVDEAMELAGVYKYKTAAPHHLSGGQKQRVAIAGVIAMRPSYLVLDEATAMLDPVGRDKVLRTVHRLNREEGITVVQITHYMEEAAMAKRVIVLHEGRIALDGTPAEVFYTPGGIAQYGLELPDAAQLIDRLAAAGLSLPKDTISAESAAKALYQLLKGHAYA